MAFELQTLRLDLRPIVVDDIDDLHALWTHRDVRRYLWDDIVIDHERVATEINRSLASFYIYKFGIWALSLRGEKLIVGFAGLRRFHNPPQTELLYGLHPDHWHKGLATEAARAVLRYGFEVLEIEKIFAGSDPPNAASQRVIRRLGMADPTRIKINNLDADYCSLTRAAFAQAAR
jgi:[ribosomal protein S5]-alanine N-acetyltransferase